MYLTIFEQAETAEIEALNIAPESLYHAFEQVTDGRKSKGKRYPLPLLLTLLLLGKLAGETTVRGIIEWIGERQGWVRAQFDWPKRFPVQSTYSEALARCDAEQIATVVAQVILKARAVQECGTEPSRLQATKQQDTLTHVAMDGKTLRGTLGHRADGQPSVHLLGFYDGQSGIVLAQRAVASKENEISAAAALVHPTLVKGRIISTDALHTQKKWCTCVHGYGGYYLTIVKLNQPTLYKDIQDFFDDPDAEQDEWQYAKRAQKGHGRLETREIWTSTQMNEWFERDWTGLAQIFRLRRVVKEGDKQREEVVYGITNLPRKKASAARLLALQQEHWHIENRLHYRRDVTLGEDACQVRIAGAPQAVAALNGAVLALMDWLQIRNVASQMRHFCAHPHEALLLLCGELSRYNG
ncbi:MAG: ISAs1 family transposase [Ktedonobacteraceae bacterium]